METCNNSLFTWTGTSWNFRDPMKVVIIIYFFLLKTDPFKWTLESTEAHCVHFMFAATVAIPTVVSFALYEIAKNANIQDKLRREIEQHGGQTNGLIQYEAANQMSYLHNIVLGKKFCLPFSSLRLICLAVSAGTKWYNNLGHQLWTLESKVNTKCCDSPFNQWKFRVPKNWELIYLYSLHCVIYGSWLYFLILLEENSFLQNNESN